MTSRICFSFAAVIALVLFVAALPSRATERRDPLIVPDAQQQSAKTVHSSHAKTSQKKHPARNTHQQNASNSSAEKSSNQSVPASFEAKDQVGPEVSSGSSKNARTGAGK
jgi:predicted lipid-binding transport protein (Tim44 family)